MTTINHFDIGWTDLNSEAQEEIRHMVRSRISDDPIRMGEVSDEAIEEHRSIWPEGTEKLTEADSIDMKLDEIVEDECIKNFMGRGSV